MTPSGRTVKPIRVNPVSQFSAAMSSSENRFRMLEVGDAAPKILERVPRGTGMEFATSMAYGFCFG